MEEKQPIRVNGYKDETGYFHAIDSRGLINNLPDILPGVMNLQTGAFTPTGNPKSMTSYLESEIGLDGKETVLSGMYEDKGAHVAPTDGVSMSGLDIELLTEKIRAEERAKVEAEIQADAEATEIANGTANLPNEVEGDAAPKTVKKRARKKAD